MTGCFKLARVLQSGSRFRDQSFCQPCVYFSRNLDTAQYTVLLTPTDHRCGLGFLPGDDSCTEMRTDNCSARKNSG